MPVIVRVVQAVDVGRYDVRPYVGRLGIWLGKTAGLNGQPFHMVRFSDGTTIPFVREEIEACLVTAT